MGEPTPDLRCERDILIDIEAKLDDVLERLERIECREGDAPWVR